MYLHFFVSKGTERFGILDCTNTKRTHFMQVIFSAVAKLCSNSKGNHICYIP